MRKIIASLALFVLFLKPMQAQTSTNLLAIDANEDTLTATLSYNGALIDIFGFAQGMNIDQGRLAISVVGPQSPQELRILKRNALGLVSQSSPVIFDRLPGFWALHATPAPTRQRQMAITEFKKLPSLLQDWSLQRSETTPLNKNDINNAMDAQIRNGRLSVNNQTNLRGNGLFNTTLELPAFAPVGTYEIQAHWFGNDGSHLISAPKSLMVKRGPVANWIKSASHNQALLFGLICVIIAVIGGLMSEIVFQRFAP